MRLKLVHIDCNDLNYLLQTTAFAMRSMPDYRSWRIDFFHNQINVGMLVTKADFIFSDLNFCTCGLIFDVVINFVIQNALTKSITNSMSMPRGRGRLLPSLIFF